MTASFATFLAPPVILSGESSTGQLGGRMSDLIGATDRQTPRGGASTVLLAADNALVQNGLTRLIVESLEEAALDAVVETGFGPELTADQIDAATAVAREAGCVGVVGAGGGTVLDAAKMIAILLRDAGSVRSYIAGVAAPVRRLPLALIPTTVGTGAEVTRVSMVSVGGNKKIVAGESLIPDVAILDPLLVAGLPPKVVGATGMDALATQSSRSCPRLVAPSPRHWPTVRLTFCASNSLRLTTATLIRADSFSSPPISRAWRQCRSGARS